MTDRVLKLAFCVAVILFAVFHFSENTADPDLWGHVLFGQRMIHQGSLDRVEPFSWTAFGHLWINHELLAEIAFGLAHWFAGGMGLLLLKVAVGLLTFWMVLCLGSQGMDWPMRAVAWGVGLIAVVEISFGFAARPQIFTALGLACELWILRRVHDGRKCWAFMLPVLFVVWINTHGGVVAGMLVLAAALAGTTVQTIWIKIHLRVSSSVTWDAIIPWLWWGAGLSAVALWLNPWGMKLPCWLVSSVLWSRPEIEEWNPAPFGLDHGPLFILVALTAVALLTTKRNRALWEVAVLVCLGIAALRYVRNAPLFAVAALALLPPYLIDFLRSVRKSMMATAALILSPVSRWMVIGCLLLLSGLMLRAVFTLHKADGLTMEVPARYYPVSAIRFIQEHALTGNLFVYFDWGEMCLWELPNCPPSIDGRLDTCYSHDVITANWQLYNGEEVDPRVLNLSHAELALLPRHIAGVNLLAQKLGWKVVYADPLAVVLVRCVEHFPRLSGLKLPILVEDIAVRSRFPFPDQPPVLSGL